MNNFIFYIDNDVNFTIVSKVRNSRKEPLKTKFFNIKKLSEVEPLFLSLYNDDIKLVHVEKNFNGDLVSEVKYFDGKKEYLSKSDLELVEDLVQRISLNEEFDYINKPPSHDDEVEKFIKEFFSEEKNEKQLSDDEELLEEFFKEIEK